MFLVSMKKKIVFHLGKKKQIALLAIQYLNRVNKCDNINRCLLIFAASSILRNFPCLFG